MNLDDVDSVIGPLGPGVFSSPQLGSGWWSLRCQKAAFRFKQANYEVQEKVVLWFNNSSLTSESLQSTKERRTHTSFGSLGVTHILQPAGRSDRKWTLLTLPVSSLKAAA